MNERRQLMYDNNIEVIERFGPRYTWSSDDKSCMLIREYEELKIDFYPHTGKWKEAGKGRKDQIMYGGVGTFIKWYDERLKELNIVIPCIGEFL